MFKNFSYLVVLRIFTLVLPIFIFPLLNKTYGSAEYGKFVWSMALVNFAVLFTKYGFDLFTTRQVANCRLQSPEMNELVSQVIWTKAHLAFFISLSIIVLTNFIPYAADYKNLVYLFLPLVIGEIFLPIWFFHGIERMQYTAFAIAGSRVFFALTGFILIKYTDQIELHAFVYSTSVMLSSIIIFLLMFKKYNLTFQSPNYRLIANNITQAAPLFTSNISNGIKDLFIVNVIERFLGLDSLAVYDLIIRLQSVCIAPFHILSSVMFPRAASGIINTKLAFSFSSVPIILLTTILLYNTTKIMNFLNVEQSFESYTFTISILLMLPVMTFSNLLASIGLAANGLNFQVMSTTLIANLVLLSAIFLFLSNISLTIIGAVMLTSILVEMVLRAKIYIKFRFTKC